MQDLYERQVAIEEQYSHASIIASIKQTQDAINEGRAADTGIGKRIVAKAFEVAKEELTRICVPKSGAGGKYRSFIRRGDIDVITIASLRLVLGHCVKEKSPVLQDVCRGLGQMVETEVLIEAVSKQNSAYAAKTLAYLDNSRTTDIRHRNRTFTTAANALRIDWEPWGADERIGVGRLIMTALYETGLFKWEDFYEGKGRIKPIQVLRPSDVLASHVQQAVDASKSIVRFPPMLVPPRPWVDPYNGGYLTDWYQQRASMVSLRAPRSIRRWVLEGLAEGKGGLLKRALTNAQNVPYRVNKGTLRALEAAVASGEGLMGLARSAPEPKPEFPFVPAEKFNKDECSPGELQEFKQWKNLMHLWHTRECTRIGQSVGLLSKVKELQKYQNQEKLYFPTFVDWRGRMYFRSTLNPQSNDAVKSCLELAEGKPLGERGMFWLKVHIANCAGYDKHDPTIKAKWTEDNMAMLMDFCENPLEVQPPEPDTAFTLYTAMCAYRDAMLLPNPYEYVCHVPVAMDATCSGLQHFSAMLRDPVGGYYTNLVDSGLDQKSDIYKKVGELADAKKLFADNDPVVVEYWKDKPITRKMAKRPVMTYVYGSTLKSTMDYVSLDMQEAGMPDIKDNNGKILYSLHKLAVPVGKALREAVEETVPAAAEGMDYLQSLVRASTNPIQWVTPVGMPVVNWSEELETRDIKIRSMGRTSAVFKLYNGQYNRRAACNGISPNFVHSMDSAHLCLVLAKSWCQIIPIHDSFATHACDVDEMHIALRHRFVEMYQEDVLGNLASSIIIREGYDITVPPKGTLDIQDVKSSRFMFC
jgi:DNA-directed RNA polymerase